LKRGLLALIAVAMLVIGVNLWQTHGPRDPEPPPTRLAEAPSKKDTDAPQVKPPRKEEPAPLIVPSTPPPKEETDPESSLDRTEPAPKTDATEASRREARRAARERAYQLSLEAASLRDRKDFEAAIEKMRQAVELVPDADYHVGFLGGLECQAGKYEDSLKHSLQAIRLNDKNPWHHLNAGCSAYFLQELSLAEKHLAKAVAAGPKELDQANFDWAENQLNDIRGQTYYVLWTMDPKKKTFKDKYGEKCLVPIPATDLPYQTSTYEVRGAQSHEVVKEDGNVFLLVEPDGTNPFELIFTVNVRTYSYKSEIDKLRKEPTRKRAQRPNSAVEALISLPVSCGGEEEVARADDQGGDPDPFLGASPTIDPKGKQVTAVSAKLKGNNDVETILNTLGWLKQNVKYNATAQFGTTDDIVNNGTAHCGGYAATFTALTRASSIPTRPVRGPIRSGLEFAPPGHFCFHSWNEVKLGGKWYPVEPQQPNSLGMSNGGYIRFNHYGVGGKENPSWVAEQMGGLPRVVKGKDALGFDMKVWERFARIKLNPASYKPDGDQTHCNGFLVDYAKGLLKGHTPPQLLDEKGNPAKANIMFDQVSAAARAGNGWRSLSLAANLDNPGPIFQRAQELANQGKLVIIGLRTSDGTDGHFAAVVPSFLMADAGDSWGSVKVPYLAQAGPVLNKGGYGNRWMFDANSPIAFNFAFPSREKVKQKKYKIEIFVVQ
jgi:hypothetical protein